MLKRRWGRGPTPVRSLRALAMVSTLWIASTAPALAWEPTDGGVAQAAVDAIATEAPADDLHPGAPAADAAAPKEVTRASHVAFRSVLALFALLVLAYVAGHPRVHRVEAVLGVSQVVAAGLPFFALGALARAPAVGLLTDDVLAELRPLLELGLGLVGVLAGLQFDLRALARWPRSTGRLAVVLTAVPFVLVSLSVGGLLYAFQIPTSFGRLVRDAITFGAAGCLAAPTATALLAGRGLSFRAIRRVRDVATLDDAAGVAVLAVLSAFFRPNEGVAWALPGIGWLFMTLGDRPRPWASSATRPCARLGRRPS